MRKILYFSILTLILVLSSCSSQLEKGPTVKGTKKTVEGEYTFFELINRDEVKLIFRGIENPKPKIITLHQGVSQDKLGPGHWELIGFHYQKKDFESMHGGKRFVLKIKKNSITYGGSILIGCPKVSSEQNYLLKEMSFFDRYSFRSSKRLCEVIVGNQLPKVQTNLNSSKESNELKVEVGF